MFLYRRLASAVMSTCTETWPRIILFGDSLTQYSFSSDGCWGALLTDYTQRKCDVVCRGFSGYNVRMCRHLLPQLVTPTVAKDTVAITIFLGANDSNNSANAQQHVPLAEYRDGLTAMVDYLMTAGVSRDKVILISPPAFCAEMWEQECIKKGKSLTKDNQTTGEYAKACVAVAEECGTKLVDLYSHMMKTPNWETFLNDGLHLSSLGSGLLFSLLQPIVDQLTSNIALRYPYWDDVDLHDLKACLVPFKQ